ncbi:MAG: DUF5752 family protein [Gammaproteobacteria bacterium]
MSNDAGPGRKGRLYLQYTVQTLGRRDAIMTGAEDPNATPKTMPDGPVFTVKDCALIAIATGRRASTLTELRDNLEQVSAGGIRLQVIDHHTRFRVSTPEGASLRIRYLLHQPERLLNMRTKAREFVRENFLLTRQLREYLTLMLALRNDGTGRIELA